ncbi:MAG: ATP-binding protein, partial [Bryobacteraceae bacterium]
MAELKDYINQMISNLRATTLKNTEQDWLKTNVARFTRMLQGQRDLLAVSKLVLSELAPLVSAQHGIFYINQVKDGEPSLKLLASYAFRERKNLATEFKYGEGLVGQCALEKERILLTDVPQGYIKISSGLGESTPLNIVVLPVLFEGRVKAVIEMASFNRFNEVHLSFLEQLVESMGIVLNTIEATMTTEELLKQSQALTLELQSRQEELTEGNKRLAEQAQTLKRSEELLRTQQEQLQGTNDELQEKARLLAEQKSEVENKNKEVEQAKQALEEKAEQLALISKYKSEFLANMSHELRTPLNSLLILAKVLAENAENRLSPKQVKFAETIYSAGTDLLALINDILDLSKIESGMMAIDQDDVHFSDIRDYVFRTFRHVADGKGLAFTVETDNDLPRIMSTDVKRLQQVLKNLISNALKFTDEGKVSLHVHRADTGWSPDNEALNNARNVIAFSVTDTGIGISGDKQKIIFEAFRQADGTTNRKYGGTGLGLSISREIAKLLGGEITLESSPSEGSRFTLYLPQTYVPTVFTPSAPAKVLEPRPADRERPRPLEEGEPPVLSSLDMKDDRSLIEPGDRVLLMIEDDPHYVPMLLDLAHNKGFKAVVALRGDKGLQLARDLKPDAITLDIRLPDMAGWMVLSRLKHDPATRHIPVHVISIDEDYRRGLALGADSYLEKSVDSGALADAFNRIQLSLSRGVRLVLLVDANDARRSEILELIGGSDDIFAVEAATGTEALAAAEEKDFDCAVIYSRLPDMTVSTLVEKIQTQAARSELPIVLYAPEKLTPEEEAELRRVGEIAVVKTVRTRERLLEETAVFLNRKEEELSEEQKRIIETARQIGNTLSGGKILIVDDDVRNIFALTSGLERHNLRVLNAESGREG